MRYIVFLRAINVGGRMVKMEELKKILAMPGIKNIVTYIQSGNVVLDSTIKDSVALEKKIETTVFKSLGFEVSVLIRTPEELEAIIAVNPFKEKMSDTNDLYVSFLSTTPDATQLGVLATFQSDLEEVIIKGSTGYILCPKGKYGESRFSNAFLEKKLKVIATTRNWATVNKMLELSK